MIAEIMKIGVATDHGGFGLKEELATKLRDAGHEVIDWDLVQTFLAAEYSQAERHLRRLGKVAALEQAN